MYELARQIAILNHKEQLYGNHPYVFHLDMVVTMLKLAGETDEALIAAGYLHDIIEDTRFTYEAIYDIFDKKVADIVKAVTNDRSFQVTAENIESAGTAAATVKTADRIANLIMSTTTKNTPTLKKYVSEDPLFSAHVLKNVQNAGMISSYMELVKLAKQILEIQDLNETEKD